MPFGDKKISHPGSLQDKKPETIIKIKKEKIPEYIQQDLKSVFDAYRKQYQTKSELRIQLLDRLEEYFFKL